VVEVHPNNELILDDEYLTLYLEYSFLGLFIHCITKKWNPSSYRHHKEVFTTLKKVLRKKGYKDIMCYSNNNKLTKFSSMFGFIDTNYSVVTTDNEQRRVMVCPLL